MPQKFNLETCVEKWRSLVEETPRAGSQVVSSFQDELCGLDIIDAGHELLDYAAEHHEISDPEAILDLTLGVALAKLEEILQSRFCLDIAA